MNRKETEQFIDGLINDMSLKEKTDLIHGAGFFRTGSCERAGIPSFHFSDGPMGGRAEYQDASWYQTAEDDDFVTYLASNSALASAWDPDISYESGQILGEETRGRGKDMILAPGINIKRDPRCGRNFEYMSEDPCVIQKHAAAIVKGIQKSDVSACVKHFACNNQETNRLLVDTYVDERTLNEIYLPGFKAAIKEGGAYSIMGAYNRFRGDFCCDSKYLLNDILRNKWKFDGLVVSDWGGVRNTQETAESGLDVEMSVTDDFDAYFFAKPLIKAVKSGRIDEKLIDEKVRNLLRLMVRLKMIGPDKDKRKAGCYNSEAHRRGVYKAAAESIILLKNDDNVLPLKKEKIKKLAVIGANANILHSFGGGSAEIKALYEVNPLMGLKMKLGGNVKVEYAPGYFVPGKAMNAEESWQAESTNTEELVYPFIKLPKPGQYAAENAVLNKEALRIAKDADAVIFVGGLDHNYDVEGQDREDMKLPLDQNDIIKKLLKIRPDTVVVMYAGSPVEMPWLKDCKSLLWSYYAGMEGGNALADIIFGDVNPSGKLAETFPVRYEDTVTAGNGEFARMDRVEYREGLYVGYRYYEKKKIKPAFAFGFGLSYSSFKYSDIRVSMDKDEITVRLKVKNTGKLAGKEVVELYASEDKPVVDRPLKELKGFTKVSVKAGGTKEALIRIKKQELAYYDEKKGDFVLNSGTYTLHIGPSSDNIVLTAKITL